MDIVYLFKEDPENNSEELRYSLRSLQNIPHNKVVLVGETPQWAQNVLSILVPQDKTKNENINANLATAISDERISEEFVLMNDDFFIMKQIPEIPARNFGPMDQVIKAYEERYPEETEYMKKMRTLYDLLRSRGFDNPLSYELHIPMVISRKLAKDLYVLQKGERMYQFRTFYGNYTNLGGETMKDVKVFLDSRHNDPAYNENSEHYLASQTFLSATGGSFKRGEAGTFIKSQFSGKSPYEV